MSTPKKSYSYRLSEQTIKAFEELQRRFRGRSQADIIAIAIHVMLQAGDYEQFERFMQLPV